jgi:cyanophycinase-like exopeptidase
MKKLLFTIGVLLSLVAKAQPYNSYFTGDVTDEETNPDYGVCLMGGSTEDDRAMIWFLEKANGGDILVIRASGSDGYNDYFYSDLGVEVNSVETIVFNSASAASDSYVLQQIGNAEAIWMAGGDQSDYINYWKDTEVENLLNQHINVKQAVIGGTSAGMAVLGTSYFSADNGGVYSSEALEDPYNPYMTIGHNDFLEVPLLENTITDTHFSERDREGRLLTFMARMNNELGERSFGIACDEYTAVCIDSSGLGAVYGEWPEYDDFALFVQMNCEEGNAPESLQAGTPFTWDFNGQAAKVYKVGGTTTGENYLDLNDWQTGNGGEWLHWSALDGAFNSETGTAADCNDVSIEAIALVNPNRIIVESIDLLGRTISENYAGLVIDIFDDNSVHKRVQVREAK